MSSRLSCFICSSPRSGSWLLTSGLNKSGVAGAAVEWLNDYDEKLCAERWGLPYPIDNYEVFFEKLVEMRTKDGVFAMKFLDAHLPVLARKFSTIPRYEGRPIHDILADFFGPARYIWVRRRDKLRQGISYYRAGKTGVWWNIENDEHPPVPSPEPAYDFATLARYEQGMEESDRVWQRFFEASGQQPLTVYYEDLVARYKEHVIAALQYLGIENARNIAIPPSHFKKQADAMTEEWVRRYLAEKRA